MCIDISQFRLVDAVPVSKLKLYRIRSQPPCTVNRWTGHPDCNIIVMCNLIISEISGKFNTTMAKEWSHAVPLPCCDPCQSSPPAHYRDRLYRKTAHWCSSAVNSQQTFWTTAHSDLQNKQETDCMGWEWRWEFHYFTVMRINRFDHCGDGSPMKPHGMCRKKKKKKKCFNVGAEAKQFLYCLYLGVHQHMAREWFTRLCCMLGPHTALSSLLLSLK